MNLGLEGRVALVSGASQGLGYGVARELAREGCHVAICSRDSARIEQAAASLAQETGATILAYSADVSDAEQVRAFVDAALTRFGRVDICVTNSGGPPFKSFPDTSESDWQLAYATTLAPVVHFAHAVLPLMRQQFWGRFVAITSVSVVKPIANLVLSNALRAGVNGLIRTLALENAAYGITVNNACPGYTATERLKQAGPLDAIERKLPMGRVATVEEFAGLVAFLASARASYISGETISVAGAAQI
jgi:3-oxoacyl-[acyl-carrier protein] reductase